MAPVHRPAVGRPKWPSEPNGRVINFCRDPRRNWPMIVVGPRAFHHDATSLQPKLVLNLFGSLFTEKRKGCATEKEKTTSD
jgi:hypothetical protein